MLRVRLSQVPLPVLLLGMTGLAMLLPAIHALGLREHAVARAFLYSSLFIGGLAVFLALGTARMGRVPNTRGLLPMLGTIYLLVPAAAALPLAEALADLRPGFRFRDAWFEMVAAFTTTGGTLLELPRALPSTLHLWRATVGWAGGLFILVSALAFLAPLRLGGFELLRPPNRARARPRATPGAIVARLNGEQQDRAQDLSRQHLHAALALAAPWYAGATLLVWILLSAQGVTPLNALVLAMSALSTSGILPRESLGAVGTGVELVLFAAMVLALSRGLTLPTNRSVGQPPSLLRPWLDPELRLATTAVLAMAAIVLARHWAGAYEIAEGEDLPAIGAAAWGALFTGLSFLTTTGFVSHDWIVARSWSGLTPPGLVLMGLALMGGGVATTAGGVKLLRILAMARLGRAEMHRMIHPSVMDNGSERDRFLATEGARAAWLFAMVFAITAVSVVGLLILTGETLEAALVLAVAALTTTGPLIEVAGDQPLGWAGVTDAGRLILAAAMIMGRLEILVILALALTQLSRD